MFRPFHKTNTIFYLYLLNLDVYKTTGKAKSLIGSFVLT